MKALQILLIIFTSLTGCSKKEASTAAMNTDTTVTTKTMSSSTVLTYLALGDSYTIGESVPEDQSYPYQLTGQLNKQGFDVKAPEIIAVTGWTTDDLIGAIAASNIKTNTYDMVTLLIGVNDQYQGINQDNYKVKFAQVLNTAIKFAKGDVSRVFVISIPDYGVTPYAEGQESVIGPQIDQFNAINKAESLKAGVHYLNITPISREASANPALIAADGLHPSGSMYTMWVKLLAPMVAERLKK